MAAARNIQIPFDLMVINNKTLDHVNRNLVRRQAACLKKFYNSIVTSMATVRKFVVISDSCT
jgi:hypothetical protein